MAGRGAPDRPPCAWKGIQPRFPLSLQAPAGSAPDLRVAIPAPLRAAPMGNRHQHRWFPEPQPMPAARWYDLAGPRRQFDRAEAAGILDIQLQPAGTEDQQFIAAGMHLPIVRVNILGPLGGKDGECLSRRRTSAGGRRNRAYSRSVLKVKMKAAQVECGIRIGHGVSSFPAAVSATLLALTPGICDESLMFCIRIPVQDGRMVQMDVNPRKIPRQSRAQATVRAIIEATAQVLVHAGFERMTTAMVAERAGVSVGSLYQYYPNKQALAAAVVDHYGEVFAARFAQAIAAGPGDTLARTVDALVATAFESHPHDPRLHKVLIEIAPRVGRGDHRKALSARIAALIEEKLRRHAGDLAADLDPSEAAVMLEALLETAAHRALEQHPASLSTARFAGQCRRMVMAYLTCPAGRS